MSTQSNSQSDPGESGACVRTVAVKAGHRTYFFDVRTTVGGDYYLTVTERRRLRSADGRSSCDRHQLFLYKEDFEKFAEGLAEAIGFIREQALPAAAEAAERREPAEV